MSRDEMQENSAPDARPPIQSYWLKYLLDAIDNYFWNSEIEEKGAHQFLLEAFLRNLEEWRNLSSEEKVNYKAELLNAILIHQMLAESGKTFFIQDSLNNLLKSNSQLALFVVQKFPQWYSPDIQRLAQEFLEGIMGQKLADHSAVEEKIFKGVDSSLKQRIKEKQRELIRTFREELKEIRVASFEKEEKNKLLMNRINQAIKKAEACSVLVNPTELPVLPEYPIRARQAVYRGCLAYLEMMKRSLLIERKETSEKLVARIRDEANAVKVAEEERLAETRRIKEEQVFRVEMEKQAREKARKRQEVERQEVLRNRTAEEQQTAKAEHLAWLQKSLTPGRNIDNLSKETRPMATPSGNAVSSTEEAPQKSDDPIDRVLPQDKAWWKRLLEWIWEQLCRLGRRIKEGLFGRKVREDSELVEISAKEYHHPTEAVPPSMRLTHSRDSVGSTQNPPSPVIPV